MGVLHHFVMHPSANAATESYANHHTLGHEGSNSNADVFTDV
jgi:hypothetical protein